MARAPTRTGHEIARRTGEDRRAHRRRKVGGRAEGRGPLRMVLAAAFRHGTSARRHRRGRVALRVAHGALAGAATHPATARVVRFGALGGSAEPRKLVRSEKQKREEQPSDADAAHGRSGQPAVRARVTGRVPQNPARANRVLNGSEPPTGLHHNTLPYASDVGGATWSCRIRVTGHPAPRGKKPRQRHRLVEARCYSKQRACGPYGGPSRAWGCSRHGGPNST